jgi:hypothetical protein
MKDFIRCKDSECQRHNWAFFVFLPDNIDCLCGETDLLKCQNYIKMSKKQFIAKIKNDFPATQEVAYCGKTKTFYATMIVKKNKKGKDTHAVIIPIPFTP